MAIAFCSKWHAPHLYPQAEDAAIKNPLDHLNTALITVCYFLDHGAPAGANFCTE